MLNPMFFLYRHLLWSPPKPKTSFEGKTVIVTGASSGLGKEATQWLVKLGAQVIMAVRDVKKGEAVAQEIQTITSCSPNALKVWELDLSSYTSVLAFGQKAQTELQRLDAVLANAGIHNETWRMTEGNEEHLTTNVISTALIGCLLFPKLQETAEKYECDTCISVTSSDLYSDAKFVERSAAEGQLFTVLNDEKKSNILDRYNVTKLLEIYMIREIAAAAPYDSHHVIVNCVAPGFCHSELTRDRQTFAIKVLKTLLARPTETGARTLVHAISAGAKSHGEYVEDGVKILQTGGYTTGKEGADLQRRFWVELKQILETIQPGVTLLK
jgi:NAD(P)-dependent dehydrogenase (short-subunit alcohol dehydrogenase family)